MELARRAGVAWHVIDEIISGRRTPRADLAKRISAATDGRVSAARLMGLEDAAHDQSMTPPAPPAESAS